MSERTGIDYNNLKKFGKIDFTKFVLTRKILEYHRARQSYNVLIYGQPRTGKSSYVIQVLLELYGDRWKDYVCFTKEQFIDLAKSLLQKQERVPAILWDDAGVHMFSLEWYSQGVRDAIKLLEVVNVICTSLIFTTPSMRFVVKKLSELEGLRVGKVLKVMGQNRGVQNIRECWVYRNSIMVDGKRTIQKEFVDVFNVMLPNDIYEYYYPIRLKYLEEALQRLEQKASQDVKALAKVLELKSAYSKASEPLEEMPS